MKYIVGGYSQLSFGTKDSSFEVLLSRQIKPVLTILYNNPSLKFLLKLTMAEFEWLDCNHPEINMLINDLCKKGQLELLTSSYYDSDISMIPTHERTSHIEKSTAYIRKKFSRRPRGLWPSFQIFNPSLISVMELSSLDYIVSSAYNQSSNRVLFNKPFCMKEMGKEVTVFPTDDAIAKLLNENLKSEYKADRIKDELKKLFKASSNGLNTYMLNMDLLAKYENTSDIFMHVFSIAGNGCTTPSDFLNEHPVSKYGYLPSGYYGRDFYVGKNQSLNQNIMESNILSKNLFSLDFFRNCIKSSKKGLEIRSLLDELEMEASSSALYIPSFAQDSSYRRYCSKKLCEIEKLLASQNILPTSIDISLNHCVSEVSSTKNIIAYLSAKGGLLNKLNYTNSFYDLALNSESGLFYDTIKAKDSSKIVNISNKVFDIQVLDKRRNDFTATCNQVEFEGAVVSVTKKYKFRQNYLSVEYDVVNSCTEDIKDSIFETIFNLSLDKDPLFAFDNSMKQMFEYSGKAIDLDLSVIFDKETNITSKTVYSDVATVGGNIKDYQYTQFRIQKPLTLKPMESMNFSVMIKMDRYKEKNNDIKQ